MNISQITNYDLVNAPILENDDRHSPIIDNVVHQVDYKRCFLNNNGVKKFGYCCENRAMPYPIYIKTTRDLTEQPFYITATGMFEVQPEKFKDATDEEGEEETVEVYILYIDVPWYDEKSERKDPPDNPNNEYGFIFKLDFAY